MRIVMIDDDWSRWKRIIDMAYDAEEHLELLFFSSGENIDFTAISGCNLLMLDHDLCEFHYGMPVCPKSKTSICSCKNGLDIVNALLEENVYGDKMTTPKFTVIHSQNPLGAESMNHRLGQHNWPRAKMAFPQITSTILKEFIRRAR